MWMELDYNRIVEILGKWDREVQLLIYGEYTGIQIFIKLFNTFIGIFICILYSK